MKAKELVIDAKSLVGNVAGTQKALADAVHKAVSNISSEVILHSKTTLVGWLIVS